MPAPRLFQTQTEVRIQYRATAAKHGVSKAASGGRELLSGPFTQEESAPKNGLVSKRLLWTLSNMFTFQATFLLRTVSLWTAILIMFDPV